MDEIRINKYIADAGICSRREADKLIASGRVAVGGRPAEPGMKVSGGDTVTLDGVRIYSARDKDKVLYAYHKPRGLICSSSGRDRSPTIYDALRERGVTRRLFSIGRLDKYSSGLILLTDRGEIVNKVNKSSGAHEKEYIVTLTKPVTDELVRRMAEGVEISVPTRRGDMRNVRTRPCEVRIIGPRTVDITLTEGLNREIRRVCAALGNGVRSLKRVRIINIELNDLPEGEMRLISGEELKEFESMLGE